MVLSERQQQEAEQAARDRAMEEERRANEAAVRDMRAIGRDLRRDPNPLTVAERDELPVGGALAVPPAGAAEDADAAVGGCLLYTSPSPRDLSTSRMPSSA